MKRIYDVSVLLNENTPIFPDNPKLEIRRTLTIDNAGCNVSEISMGCHTGTHIDAPLHFLKDGIPASELPLDVLIGKAYVVEIKNDAAITLDELRLHDISGKMRILFKTHNSGIIKQKEFHKDFVYLKPQAAGYLVENGVKLVGIDYLSINKYGSEKQETHKILLENQVVIIEGLDLSAVQPGDYEILALPIKLPTDGAPARVILREI